MSIYTADRLAQWVDINIQKELETKTIFGILASTFQNSKLRFKT